ncbi:hypothetical protein A4G19_01710 [Pasteurellaceae bacterium Macca]|nr:hypothetical protein [Pasteurellaceae bacterium Macca]
MKEQQFLLNGLHCAACVRRVETVIGRLSGVTFISVNLADNTAFVQGEIGAEQVIEAIQKIGFDAECLESEQARREKQQAQTQALLTTKRRQFSLALLVGFTLMGYGMLFGMNANADNQLPWLIWAFITALTMWFSGKHFFSGAWLSLKNRTATMDTLIALSTGVAWSYSLYLTLFPQSHAHLYFEASVMIIGFLNLGKYLEQKAKQRSSQALEKLLDLAPQQAVVFEGEFARTIPVKGIKPEMRVQALTGDRLAVDGILLQGSIWVDESMLTGEALPVEKKVGDNVRAGTLVADGSGVYLAQQVGEKTALARILTAVRHAQSSKPPLAQWVDKIAAVFVPIVVTLALLSAGIWLALGQSVDFALGIFTTVLIIACPCALGLAIPLSTIAGVARSAELGVLVRNIDALQSASEVDTLVFDKTGTLTHGEMQVSHIEVFAPFTLEQVLTVALQVEQHASHPIAKAVVNDTKKRLSPAEQQPLGAMSEVQIVKGQGISARINGQIIKVGNKRFIGDLAEKATQNHIATAVFIAIDKQLAGVMSLTDQLRPESAGLIAQFQRQGYRCVMLTGDNQAVAEHYAQQLGLDGVIANLLPEQKAEQIHALQQQGRKVAMVGDGINDSPALAQANVGIAMHNGSEIALEVADLSLMKAGLSPLADILPFSQQVIKNMKQSLAGAFIYNLISIPLAAGVLYPFTGWLLNPMIAAMAMALSSITVVLNSQRLLRQKTALATP